jgi:D-alanyl-D-alanine carboxypeptidase (penicillin-binding protein 5/6)
MSGPSLHDRPRSTSSSYLTPGTLASRRRAARRRRQQRRLAGLGIGLLAVLVGGGVLLIAGAGGGRGPATPTHRAAVTAAPAVTAPARPVLSPAGLPLGHAPWRILLSNPSDPVTPKLRPAPAGGVLFNLDSGQVLWRRDPDVERPIASLTKLMTALVIVETRAPMSPVRITRAAYETAGSKVGVLPLGKLVHTESLLYGLLLPSGNDAAVALAQADDGNVARFVARMNLRAAQLGLSCTRYASPSGYIDADNFSCPADLAELAHIDLGQPRIARVTGSGTAIVPLPIKGGKLYLDNNNPLLMANYPGTTGMKTGYTIAAGECLVATAERRGVRLGVVLLHTPNWLTQAEQLLNAGFAYYHA